MKKFTFYFIGGKVETQIASSVSEAFTMLGYGQGALRALDYWKEEEIKK